MAAIAPTHTAFDDALDFFDQVLNVDRLANIADDFRVVHGVCIGAEADEPYAHAWVEQLNADTYFDGEGTRVPSRLVWQAGTIGAQRVYFAIECDSFYRAYRVARATKYPLRTACELNFQSGHYGPWRKEYADLVHGSGRILGVVTGAAPSIVIAVHDEGIAIYTP